MGPAGALALGLAAGAISTIGYAKVDLGKISLSDTCGVHNLHGMPGLLSGIIGLGCFQFKAQALGMFTTLALAIVGGLATGALMKVMPGGVQTATEFFNDNIFWEVPEDYNIHSKGKDEDNF